MGTSVASRYLEMPFERYLLESLEALKYLYIVLDP